MRTIKIRIVLQILIILFTVRTGFGTTVTAKILTTGGVAPTSCAVKFTLVGYGTNVPRVLSTNVIVDKSPTTATCDINGNISQSIQSNTTISPAGTYYTAQFYQNGVLFRQGNWTITGGTFDLNTIAPNSTVPVVPAPTGDSTYLRLDVGNLVSTALILKPNLLHPYFDVKAYGATGDGVTNDFAAIQAAIDAAAVLGGVTYFPQAIYVVGSQLSFKQGAVLKGVLAHGVSDGSVIRASGTFTLDTPIIQNSSVGVLEGVQIEDLLFDCNNRADGVNLNGVRDSVTYNLRVSNASRTNNFGLTIKTGPGPSDSSANSFYNTTIISSWGGVHIKGLNGNPSIGNAFYHLITQVTQRGVWLDSVDGASGANENRFFNVFTDTASTTAVGFEDDGSYSTGTGLVQENTGGAGTSTGFLVTTSSSGPYFQVLSSSGWNTPYNVPALTIHDEGGVIQSGQVNAAKVNNQVFSSHYTSGSTTGGILEAIAQLPTAGGVVVVDTNSTMTAAVALTLKSNIKFWCPGQTSITQSTALTDAFTIRGSDHISFLDCKIVGNGAADQASGHGIDIRNSGTTASHDIRVENGVFTGWRSDPIFVSYVTATDITGCGDYNLWFLTNEFLNNRNTSTVDTSDVHLVGAGGTNDFEICDVIAKNNKMVGTGVNQNYHGFMGLQNIRRVVVEDNYVAGKLWHGIIFSNEVNTTYTQPNNQDGKIIHNTIVGSGRTGIYIQNVGRGFIAAENVTTGNSTSPASGIQGGILVGGGATDACVTLTGNKSYLDQYEGIKITSSNLSGQTPARGGICVVGDGNEIDSPNQSGLASAGLSISASGTTNYFGQISFANLKLTGDGTNAAHVFLDLNTSTVSGFGGLAFDNSWLDKASYQLNTASVAGPQNISIIGGGVRKAPAHAVFIDKSDQVSVKGVQVRDWNTSNGTGGCIVLNANNNRFAIEGNNCVQTQGAAATSDQGIWITSSTNTNGYIGPNWVMGARNQNYNLTLAASVFATPIQLRGTATLSAGSVTVTFTAPQSFTSLSTYQCSANDTTAANTVRVNQTSGTSVTFTGTGADVVNYSCAGY